MTDLVVQRRLSPEDVEQVRRMLDVVTEADGTAPLSEHVMLHLPGGGDADVRHVLVRDGGDLVGYAHLDVSDEVAGSSGELAVHPEHRNRGIGREIAAVLLEQAPDGRLRLWAHGEHPGAAAMAKAGGFERSRALWQMRRSLDAPLPPVQLPEGVTVRTFVVGQDEQAWTEVNNRAFAEHPEQGGWSVREVTVREREPWFDPAGFFLAIRGDRLVGFHWTKVHGEQQHEHAERGHAHDLVGEVYVVGVDPSEQGNGLGPALTLVGLHHLQEKGLSSVMLYVDEKNTNAIRVYERLGFSRYATDVSFSRNGD
ncbi:MAG TPA: mycothiol synthase [Mycobacteriales bacterium]|nr:mycothiol synthase [Mycobacteriales bacterium]